MTLPQHLSPLPIKSEREPSPSLLRTTNMKTGARFTVVIRAVEINPLKYTTEVIDSNVGDVKGHILFIEHRHMKLWLSEPMRDALRGKIFVGTELTFGTASHPRSPVPTPRLVRFSNPAINQFNQFIEDQPDEHYIDNALWQGEAETLNRHRVQVLGVGLKFKDEKGFTYKDVLRTCVKAGNKINTTMVYKTFRQLLKEDRLESIGKIEGYKGAIGYKITPKGIQDLKDFIALNWMRR